MNLGKDTVNFTIDSSHYSLLSGLFNGRFLQDIAKGTHKPRIDYIFRHTGFDKYVSPEKTLERTLNDLFNFLHKSNYKFEYTYKNAIAKRLLLELHDFNEASILTEFNSEFSKADVVIVNGTTSVYEIKTELDSLVRLESQIKSYQKVFDKINVVTYNNNIKNIQNKIPSSVGIFTLENKNRITEIRRAKTNKHNIEPKAIFKCLRRDEYLNIIMAEFGFTPKVPNTMIYEECKKLFLNLSPLQAHKHFTSALKKRQALPEQLKLAKEIRDNLKMFILERPLNPSQFQRVKLRLKDKF